MMIISLSHDLNSVPYTSWFLTCTSKLVATPSTYPDIPFDMQTSRHTSYMCRKADMPGHDATCADMHILTYMQTSTHACAFSALGSMAL